MSSVMDTIFGTPSKQKQGATGKDIEKSLQFIRENMEQARQDIFNMAPKAMENRLLGSQGAMDVLKQSIPQQMESLRTGSMNAQNTLTAGLPAQIAAIRGTPLDMGGLRAKDVSPSTDWIGGLQMPEFDTSMPEAAQNGDPENQFDMDAFNRYISGLLQGGAF